MGCIYKVTNLDNGKIYIGKTCRPLNVRKSQHLRDSRKSMAYFHRAIRKYGKDSFIWEEIYKSDNEKELFKKEKEYIALYESNKHGVGYNLTIGGEGAVTGLLGSTILRRLYYEYAGLEHSMKSISRTLDILIANNIDLKSFDRKGTINLYQYLPIGYITGIKIMEKMERIMKYPIDDKKKYYVTGYYDKIVEAAS